MKWILLLLINGIPSIVNGYSSRDACTLAGSNAQTQIRKFEPDVVFVCLKPPT